MAAEDTATISVADANDARDKMRRAQKVKIQTEYLSRKKLSETPEQRAIRSAKYVEYHKRWREKNLEENKARANKARREKHKANPAANSEICRKSRLKNGAEWNATRRAKYAESETKRAAIKEANRRDYEQNRERRIEEVRQYRAANPEKAKESGRLWREANPGRNVELAQKWAAENPERFKANIKRWREQNPDYRRERYRSDVEFRLASQLRGRLRRALERAGVSKSTKALDLVGCTLPELKAHIEAQFEPDMSWADIGLFGIHIDHIRPVCTFDLTDPEQQKLAFYYTNLRPLWSTDNLARSRARWRPGDA